MCKNCENKKPPSKKPIKFQVGKFWAIDFEPLGIDKAFMISALAVAHTNAYHDWVEGDGVDRHTKFAEMLDVTREEAKIICYHYEWQHRRIASLQTAALKFTNTISNKEGN